MSESTVYWSLRVQTVCLDTLMFRQQGYQPPKQLLLVVVVLVVLVVVLIVVVVVYFVEFEYFSG